MFLTNTYRISKNMESTITKGWKGRESQMTYLVKKGKFHVEGLNVWLWLPNVISFFFNVIDYI
jgi:hypothetical protein